MGGNLGLSGLSSHDSYPGAVLYARREAQADLEAIAALTALAAGWVVALTVYAVRSALMSTLNGAPSNRVDCLCGNHVLIGWRSTPATRQGLRRWLEQRPAAWVVHRVLDWRVH